MREDIFSPPRLRRASFIDIDEMSRSPDVLLKWQWDPWFGGVVHANTWNRIINKIETRRIEKRVLYEGHPRHERREEKKKINPRPHNKKTFRKYYPIDYCVTMARLLCAAEKNYTNFILNALIINT